MADTKENLMRAIIRSLKLELEQADQKIGQLAIENYTQKERIEELEKKAKLLQAARNDLLNRLRYSHTH